MGKLSLDSTVLIDMLRGRPGVGERVKVAHQLGDSLITSAVNVEEVYAGLRVSERGFAEALFRWIAVVPIGLHAAQLAGDWRRQQLAKGKTIGQGDCLIAATARLAGAVLATGNPKDFPFEELEVQHWPAGE